MPITRATRSVKSQALESPPPVNSSNDRPTEYESSQVLFSILYFTFLKLTFIKIAPLASGAISPAKSEISLESYISVKSSTSQVLVFL